MQDNPPKQPGAAKPVISAAVGLAWSLLYIVLIAPVFVFSALGGEWLGRKVWTGLSPLFHGIVWMSGVLLITWLVRVKVNRRPWADLGLPRPQVSRVALGALAGMALILIAAFIEYEAGWLHFLRVDTSLHRGVGKPLMIILQLLPSLAVGVCEETAFRGYVFQTLGERTPAWLAAILMSVVFGLAHFTLSGFNVSFVVTVTVISLMFLSLRFATGSLWFGIGFHGAWDWTQTYLVGLSTTGAHYDPALVQFVQTGPSFWVGSQQAIESGALFMLIVLCVLVVALGVASAAGRLPRWTQRLSASGAASTVRAPRANGEATLLR
jgi:membrane protease YdiL (CAAX protease family)